ncbi:PQQ-binding-like beta-propeller repeat protein [Dyadobacter pollutisoli]|uniref:PQQ-binding-like beta-propeller repeat protein n=1 Tax=Dyadobacter pollutisoli TaxID=2910158 RepID=A0A9E8NE12_9BACT|nr:PQQ-binding-like beta-propeller repeat protein [Dyadobacter pollutisoli]WAC15025.1 PQQ-binding-like beta-propeller repeat protein [Dyadobacter pollutisoli]
MIALVVFLVVQTGYLYLSKNREKKEDWPAFGHDESNNKYSALDQVNTKNVANLQLAWKAEDDAEDRASVLFNPLIVNGIMYAFMPSEKLAAIDASTGKKIWEFKPDSTVVSTWTRGITFHHDKGQGADVLLFVYGSTLYSVRAADGKLNEAFGMKGRVDFYTGLSVEPSKRQAVHVTVNAPGVIYGDLFIVGCKVPDELPSTSGDIRAFNANTGKLEWVFHTIPQKGEFGSETWPADARKKNGGANCWGGMALDKKRGIVYVPTASPSFDFYGADREGQNLFANCLLALNAKTGKRIWHFQTTHHDLWDRDNGSPPNLLTVKHHGKDIDAVALATKLGYVFVFNRETGEPLFPIKEVPVPTKSDMPGEKPWPTQPFPQKPGPFARQGFKEEYITDQTPELNKYFKDQIKSNRYQTGIYDPPNLTGSIILPTAHGGSNWGGASLNPQTGVMFINSNDLPWFLKLTEIKGLDIHNDLSGKELFGMYCSGCHGADKKGTNYGPNIARKIGRLSVEKLDLFIKKGAEPMPSFKHLPQAQIDAIVSYLKGKPVSSEGQTEQAHKEPYGFSGYDFYKDTSDNFAIKPPYGTLNAIDLNKGEILWQVPLGEDEKLAKMGIKNSGIFNRGGGIATAGGLVFIAATVDGKFRAFEQKTGKILWSVELPGNGCSIPSTYAVNGKQYVTIGVSANPAKNFKGGYLTFALK